MNKRLDSVIERQADKMRAAKLLNEYNEADIRDVISRCREDIESDSTEVLLNMSPQPDPVVAPVPQPMYPLSHTNASLRSKSPSKSAKQHPLAKKNSIRKGRSSHKTSGRRQPAFNAKRSSSEESSEATLVSEDYSTGKGDLQFVTIPITLIKSVSFQKMAI